MSGVAEGEMQFASRPKRGTPIILLLVYALPLLCCLYGLKCIVAQRGRLPVGGRFVSRYAFHLRTVTGSAATFAGLGYISLGVFGALCVGNPPPAGRRWIWRAGRGVGRWGCLVAGFWVWQKAYEKIGKGIPWPTLSTADDFRALLVVLSCFGIVFVLCFLSAMYQREAVKRELKENGCVPRHILWQPAAYWNTGCRAAAFRVTYLDPMGALHLAYCYVSRSWSNSIWASRWVRWLQDEVIREPPSQESWVFVDPQIVRRKLK
jgi:hypothetical protein